MTTPQPDSVRLIPLSEIAAVALPRDRLAVDDQPLVELMTSILVNGLRMPVEVCEMAEPRETESGPPLRYGLISGFRRLAAYRRIDADLPDGRFAAIPAFLRQPRSNGHAMALMVEENENRVEISPWERARIVSEAVAEGFFDTIDEAVAGLHPLADRHRRARLRLTVPVYEELDRLLATPERLSQSRMLKLAAGIAAGYGEVIATALAESSARTLEAQWQVLKGVLAELGADPEAASNPGPARPGYPRRVVRPREGLTIRRERTRDGWCLHFTGREARGGLMDDILDDVEQRFGTG